MNSYELIMALYEGFFIDQCIRTVIARESRDIGMTEAICLLSGSLLRTSGLPRHETLLEQVSFLAMTVKK